MLHIGGKKITVENIQNTNQWEKTNPRLIMVKFTEEKIYMAKVHINLYLIFLITKVI